MILYIDTTDGKLIELALEDKGEIIAKKKVSAAQQQAEKLLPAVEKLLQQSGLKITVLTKVRVKNSGGSFTALRIGVVTANALAFALGLPIEADEKADVLRTEGLEVVVPKYSQEPQITQKKSVRPPNPVDK